MVRDTSLRRRHPGPIWASELREAAYYHGYRGEAGEADGWLFFRNQEGVPGEIALAAGPEPDGSPWFLAIDHPGVVAELMAEPAHPVPGRFDAAFSFSNRAALHAAIKRTFELASSVPDHPLEDYLRAVAHLGDTEIERLERQRIGQDRFRSALMSYWDGQCPLTGITEPELLKASHIVAWSKCSSDGQRLDVHNGLLLSAHWDAAFDTGLVSFDALGDVLIKPGLSSPLASLLGERDGLKGKLTAKHEGNMRWHRVQFGFEN